MSHNNHEVEYTSGNSSTESPRGESNLSSSPGPSSPFVISRIRRSVNSSNKTPHYRTKKLNQILRDLRNRPFNQYQNQNLNQSQRSDSGKRFVMAKRTGKIQHLNVTSTSTIGDSDSDEESSSESSESSSTSTSTSTPTSHLSDSSHSSPSSTFNLSSSHSPSSMIASLLQFQEQKMDALQSMQQEQNQIHWKIQKQLNKYNKDLILLKRSSEAQGLRLKNEIDQNHEIVENQLKELNSKIVTLEKKFLSMKVTGQRRNKREGGGQVGSSIDAQPQPQSSRARVEVAAEAQSTFSSQNNDNPTQLECQFCKKILSKGYLRAHQRFRCKAAPQE